MADVRSLVQGVVAPREQEAVDGVGALRRRGTRKRDLRHGLCHQRLDHGRLHRRCIRRRTCCRIRRHIRRCRRRRRRRHLAKILGPSSLGVERRLLLLRLGAQPHGGGAATFGRWRCIRAGPLLGRQRQRCRGKHRTERRRCHPVAVGIVVAAGAARAPSSRSLRHGLQPLLRRGVSRGATCERRTGGRGVQQSPADKQGAWGDGVGWQESGRR